jgi:MFS family permease
VWSGAGASGLALGSLLGGLLTGAWGWEAVFYVNVPLAALAIIGAYLLLPADGPRARDRRFDIPGAVLATAGISLLAYALIQGPDFGWNSPLVTIGFVLAAVLLGTFVAVEKAGADPLMPLRLFGNRSLSSAIAVILAFGATFNALPYFLTLYFQTVLGYGAVATGLAFLVPSLLIALGTQLGGRLAGRIGMRATLLTGTVGGAAGTALLALGITAEGSYWGVLPGIAVMGVSQGFTWTGMWIASATGVADGEQGVASGMASTALQVGAALGLAVLVAAGGIGESTGPALASGMRTAMLIAAAGMLLGTAVALTFAKRRAAEPIPA